MLDAIDTFIEAYSREIDFYQEAARLCAQELERLLSVNGIRSIITFRAKRPDRLREKLVKRNLEKCYKNDRDIRADIVDFAGIRAALYFPDDRRKLDSIVREAFDAFSSKDFPEEKITRPKKRFTGYHSTHYRVRLRRENLSEAQQRYASTPIEIQVASVLMHAWSEVEHDLIYKPASGSLSEDEYAILDELNGLVLAGEIALERLQRAVENRVARGGATFVNHYELAAFLYEEIKSAHAKEDVTEPSMGRVDVLLELLRNSQIDTPDAIRPYIKVLDCDPTAYPIADQIADRILAEKPELYSSFVEFQAAIGPHNPYSWPDRSEKPISSLIGEFLSRWIVFERFFRMLVRERDLNVRNMYAITSQTLRHVLEADPLTLDRIQRLRELRNRLVHGIRIPDQATLRAAVEEFDSIFTALDANRDPKIKAAMRWARSSEDDQRSENAIQNRPAALPVISPKEREV